MPNKLYLAERFIQTSCNSISQGIGTSVTENWRRRGEGARFLSRGGRGGGGGGQWRGEIFMVG